MPKSTEEFVDGLMETMKSHFGNAAKAYWFYVDELCPCCQVHEIDEFILKDERAVSINGFMYRDKGVLIGYFLCGECAKKIHALTIFQTTPMHKAIEAQLIQAYQRYLSSLDA